MSQRQSAATPTFYSGIKYDIREKIFSSFIHDLTAMVKKGFFNG